MGRRLLPALVPTTAKEGVPKVYHEPHVETGFRQLGQPWSYYLCSLFQYYYYYYYYYYCYYYYHHHHFYYYYYYCCCCCCCGCYCYYYY
nr:hypothetical protein BaRGS_010610 [Batillaria attramentaria]